MRCVVQRIREGKVYVDGKVVGSANHGLLVLCGFTDGDTPEKARFMAERLSKMRIFPDENGKLNRSVVDEKGEVLIVSNFTLYADCSHGTRPDFSKAMKRLDAKTYLRRVRSENERFRPRRYRYVRRTHGTFNLQRRTDYRRIRQIRHDF